MKSKNKSLYYYLSDSTFSVVKQIGPNASISANARIGAGVRLVNCIVLDDVEIKVLIARIS